MFCKCYLCIAYSMNIIFVNVYSAFEYSFDSLHLSIYSKVGLLLGYLLCCRIFRNISVLNVDRIFVKYHLFHRAILIFCYLIDTQMFKAKWRILVF